MRPEDTMRALDTLIRGAQPIQRLLSADAPTTTPTPTTAEQALLESRRARWTKLLGGDAALALRLERDGLSAADADALLLEDHGSPITPPPWAIALAEIAARARAEDAFALPVPGADAAKPLPFEHLVAPFVRWSMDRAAPALTALAPAARDEAARPLLRRLTFMTARTALELLGAQRAATADAADAAAPDAQYRAFVRGAHADDFVPLFSAHPVLARLLATVALDTSDAIVALCQHLAADADVLAETLGARGIVEHLELLLGDPHEGGRTVARLDFANGVRVAYKPRSVRLDGALAPLLDALSAVTPVPRIPRTLDRGDHGWVEWIGHRPARDAADVVAFYEKMGAAMAIFHALGTTDIHYENVVAAGSDPYLIDLETLITPQITGPIASGEDAHAEAMRMIDASVLKSSLLPELDGKNEGDSSGLGGGTRRAKRLGYTAVNTDAMTLGETEIELEAPHHQPVLDGQGIGALAHEDAILRGFAAAYDGLLACRDEILDPNGLLGGLRGARTRVVLRNTQIYVTVASAALAPALLRSGVDRSLTLDRLARGFLDRPELWPVLRLEQRAMERGDVPRLWADVDGLAVETPDGRAEAALLSSAREQVAVRLGRFSAQDRARQISLIRTAFLAADAGAARTAPPAAATPVATSDADAEPAALLAAATALAESLAREVVRGRDGTATWIGLSFDHQAGHYRLAPLGPTMGDGTAGVAVFLAALHRATRGEPGHTHGGPDWAELARAALLSVRRRARTAPAELARELGFGGAVGVGSIVYALVSVGRALDDASLFADALPLVEHVSDAAIAADRTLDVISGGAGMILALLALYRATGDARPLERAQAIGRALLARQEPAGVGHAWRTINAHPITGFSHGASGIAFALGQLHARAPDAALPEAIEGALAFERSTFDAARRAWPDLRTGVTDDAPPVAWCHGAAGIGLARLGTALAHATEDLDDALRITHAHAEGDSDLLCCGLAGRAELLLAAAARTGRVSLRDEARRRLGGAALRARREGSYRLISGRSTTALVPGLFQGAAGVGYQLLRAALPAQVPSVLMFE